MNVGQKLDQVAQNSVFLKRQASQNHANLSGTLGLFSVKKGHGFFFVSWSFLLLLHLSLLPMLRLHDIDQTESTVPAIRERIAISSDARSGWLQTTGCVVFTLTTLANACGSSATNTEMSNRPRINMVPNLFRKPKALKARLQVFRVCFFLLCFLPCTTSVWPDTLKIPASFKCFARLKK